MSNDQEAPGMIYVEAERLEQLIQENRQLKAASDSDSARACLRKMLAVYEVLEKDGVINIISGAIGKDTNAFSLLAPIGRILPKVKKYGDNQALNDVFNLEFFETAKKAAL